MQRLVKAWRECVVRGVFEKAGHVSVAPPDFDADDYNGRPAREARATPAVIRAKGGA